MSITGTGAKVATALIAPEAAAAGLIAERVARPAKPPKKLSVRVSFLVVVIIAAVVGINSLVGFLKWPTLPALFGSQQTAPADLSPVLVQPTQVINLDQVINRSYAIDYTSPETCTTLFGACVPNTYAKKEIREIGIVPVYVNEQIAPSDITVEIDQASASKPGLITYTVTLAPPALGSPSALEKSIKIEEFVDFSGHTTPIPSDAEMRQTGLDEVAKVAAADSSAITEAKAMATKKFTEQITAIAQPLLDGLSAKHLLNGTYTISVNVLWSDASPPIAP